MENMLNAKHLTLNTDAASIVRYSRTKVNSIELNTYFSDL